MQFENIGFTKTVNRSVRYLACADCEMGPIGWHDVSIPNEFYVTASRVNYSEH